MGLFILDSEYVRHCGSWRTLCIFAPVNHRTFHIKFSFCRSSVVNRHPFTDYYNSGVCVCTHLDWPTILRHDTTPKLTAFIQTTIKVFLHGLERWGGRPCMDFCWKSSSYAARLQRHVSRPRPTLLEVSLQSCPHV